MLDRIRRVRQVQQIMALSEAINFAKRENLQKTSRVKLKQLSHPIRLRGGTTDVNCFKKIFINEEYRCPFNVEPKLIIDAGHCKINSGQSSVGYSPSRSRTGVGPRGGNHFVGADLTANVNIQAHAAYRWYF
jgi:hypothetical protein